MTNRTTPSLSFPTVCRRRVEADFQGGHVTSDAGVLLLSQADRHTGLLTNVARLLDDPRRQASVDHSLLSLLRQRVYGIASGYEDGNDHADLRHDLAWQTAVKRDEPLASPSTICRWENRADEEAAWAIHRVLVEHFIASFDTPPEELILDFDATDDEVHGGQEGRFFHGYYDHYCFLPLYVFCGEQLLVSYLRPSKIDGAKGAGAVLKLLVDRLREAWPEVRIILRADSGFCRTLIMSWCERNRVGYILGLAKNSRLNTLGQPWIDAAREGYGQTALKQRVFGEFSYAAKSWKRQRRVIIRAEHGARGDNPRYIVTNLPGDAQTLYDEVYCQRGEMENRIKEQQLDLFADRTSCHRWWPNQLRLLLASLAYTLLETVRRLGLKGTELARAQCGTMRLKLLKIGAVIVRNTRRVRLMLSSAYPYRELFALVAQRLGVVVVRPPG